jgi:hypothetical protein
MMSIYTEQGYKNRRDYLENLADDYGVPFEVVDMLASVLGPSEDFDALVCEVEEYAFQRGLEAFVDFDALAREDSSYTKD